jgi:hypothetical protein
MGRWDDGTMGRWDDGPSCRNKRRLPCPYQCREEVDTQGVESNFVESWSRRSRASRL